MVWYHFNPEMMVSQAMDYSGDRVVGRKKTYKHSLDRSSKYNPFQL